MSARTSLALAGMLTLGVSAAFAETPVTLLEEVVMYAIDSDTNELVRYDFGTDTLTRIGVVSDRFGNVITDVEALAYVRHGPFKDS